MRPISGEKQKQTEQQTNTQEATVGYEQQKELVVFCHTQQFVERKPVRQSEMFEYLNNTVVHNPVL